MLRVATGLGVPDTLDPARDGFRHVRNGMGETLTRLAPDGTLEPWLAESVTNVDPVTWRATLRPNARFWDDSPVTAEAVVAAFKRCWESQPAASAFLSKETEISAADARTLTFKTPRPAGDLPLSLASRYFVVHKPPVNGTAPMSGPYRPVRLDVDQELVLEPFPGHWAGQPPIARISVRHIADANARALGLQGGDLDLVQGILPESIPTLGSAIEMIVRPAPLIYTLLLNHRRLPFADRDVRGATASAIDRAALNTVGLDGRGVPATGLFPPDAGIEVVPAQALDAQRARRLLDEAGWRPGTDGVRAKDGQRLAFTLYSHPARPEFTPMAVSIQAQLKPLGYDIQVQEVRDTTAQVKDGDFDASMWNLQVGTLGDPQYMFGVGLVKDAAFNYGRYANPVVDELYEKLRQEPDRTQRHAIGRQIQEAARVDVPYVYLVAPPLTVAYQKGRVAGYTVHPSDLYFIDRQVSVSS